jgi:hypothetical protein
MRLPQASGLDEEASQSRRVTLPQISPSGCAPSAGEVFLACLLVLADVEVLKAAVLVTLGNPGLPEQALNVLDGRAATADHAVQAFSFDRRPSRITLGQPFSGIIRLEPSFNLPNHPLDEHTLIH